MAAIAAACSLPAVSTLAVASEPLAGRWLARDASSGVESTIELFLESDQMYGRIVSLRTQDGEVFDPICTGCKGALKDAKVVGAIFITGLRRSGDKWVGGKVVDLRPGPMQGTIANCEIELLQGRVKLFGYLWLRWLSGTDYWERAPAQPQP
ncbi:DUF2147 domain-containing protein [Ideonella paludis]|uniref:DUF2147 domain-containing protein n=1 Tax=Ideonella paludis TaxID=1233411 RepID=A0ABS5DXW4_9BURK|nr:DUF2147 domain-containing protein [Ideonella paludis]